MYLPIPLEHDKQKGFVAYNYDVKESIGKFLELIVLTPQGGCECLPDFGFVFKNFRFQNFNEKDSTLFSNGKESSPCYEWKIPGKSMNSNTFARELKRNIEIFEPRLKQVNVDMVYSRERRIVQIKISGKIANKFREPFSHEINIHVW